MRNFCLRPAAGAHETYPNIRLFAVAQSAATTPQPDVPVFNGSSTPCWWPQNPLNNSAGYQCNTWQTARAYITDEFSAVS